jgi:transmembrane sensor
MEELISKHLSGEASAEETKQVEAWVALRPENDLHFQKIKKVFEMGSAFYQKVNSSGLTIDVNHEWNHFVNTVSRKETKVRSITLSGYASNWIRIAAAIVLLIASGLVINYFISKNQVMLFQTSENILTVPLPDGSTVTLNKNSSLTYAPSFGEANRKVTLEGEAFFEVKRNPQKPFIISVNKTEVEVLGTSFNVQGYDGLPVVEVIVATGVVKFSAPGKNKEVTLRAGEKGVYSMATDLIDSGANEDINFLSWNTQKIVFEETGLRSVVETLNRVYSSNLIIATEISPSCVVTVSFDHQTLEAVLNVLKTTLNLTYKITGNKIEIVSAGC